MGICIGITVSARVPKEKWRTVYDEALYLAQKLNLADEQKKEIGGHIVRCLTPTEETELNGRKGWRAVADHDFGDAGEDFFFPKQLCEPKSQGTVDILALHACDIGLIQLEDIGFDRQEIWGNKTQGRFYHYGLLAVGCLVQDRLGDEALVHGDINAGQCREAVQRANEHLEKPIQIPCQCEPDRWMERVGRLAMDDIDRVRISMGLYIGKKDAAFGETLRAFFSNDVLCRYWKEEFSAYAMNTAGFRAALKLYLTMGFDIAALCDLVPMKDKDGSDLHEKFICLIMDSKLHWKEKDCSDVMEHDPDDPTLYGVKALLIRFLTEGARNKKVERYVPIDTLRRILHEKLGQDCDVDAIIDSYLLQEKELENAETLEEKIENDESAEINRLMNKRREEISEKAERYEIYAPRLLRFYEPGWKIEPHIEQSIRTLLNFVDTLTETESYREAAAKPVWEQGDMIVAASDHVPTLRDRDWERIFSNLDKAPNCFRRYYALFGIDLDDQRVRDVVTALIINDDLYEYARTILKTTSTLQL